MKKIFIYIVMFCSSLKADNQLPTPYNTLKNVLPFNKSGMYTNAIPMENLLKETNARIVIEVGSWLGESSRHIANCLPEDGKLYCIDHWLGNSEHQVRCQKELPKLYDQFLSNVIHTKLTHKIFPIRMTSLEAINLLHEMNIEPDVVYIDASHDEESVYKDLEAYYPFVKNQGILCGDDWGWGKTLPVQCAVKRFAENHGLRIEVHKNNLNRLWFWVLREI